MHNPTFLVLNAILSSLVIQSVVATKAASDFSVELIHRDSPLSPFYNGSLTSSELLRKNALYSMERIKNFQSLIDQKAIQSVVIPNGGSYLMKLSFGTPPVEYLAIADTGSDFIWIQCAPCPQTKCYSQDKSYTIGILSTDTLSFDSSNGQKAAFPTSTFGCGHNNQGHFRSPGAGLVGLGGGPLSLVSQIGTQIDHRFSYCLVPLSAKSSSVSIGDKTARAASSQGNIIIDSGTALTILESNFYNSIETYVAWTRLSLSDMGGQKCRVHVTKIETMGKEAIGAEPVQDSSGAYSLCYGAETNINVPEMVFHFTGAHLRLQPVNIFAVNGDLFCMLIVPSDNHTNSLSIFGNSAQINFHVEYDLQKKTVSFAPTDCTKQ
ncbi:hypothetical protein CRYUN_Cryun39dG0071300 [Craigia yunnanensis]